MKRKIENLKPNLIIIGILLILLSLDLISQDANTFNSREAARQTVQFLASPETAGRFPGTPGIELAAEHIIDKFKAYGIKPFNNDYRQNFDIPVSVEPGEDNKIVFQTIIPRPGVPREEFRQVSRTWETMSDWIPLPFSEDGNAQADVAFVGYGITSEDLKYDDYAGIDVSGKVVIMLTNSPDGDDYEGKGKFNSYSSLRYKATNARNHGAVGIIFTRISGDSMNVFERYEFSTLGRNSGIIAVQANRHSIDRFFPRNNKLIELEKKINSTLSPQSFFVEDLSVNITVELKDKFAQTSNIVGYIEGTDSRLKDEYIVIGAHYDHLGWGISSSRYKGRFQKIHIGADDNASGVAGILELARRIKENPLKRSVVVIAFSAEELGLHGSRYYVNNSKHSLENTKIMLNFDMIGRLKSNQISVFGTGSAENLDNLLSEIADTNQLSLTSSLGALGPSDHSSFYRAKVPAVHIFTGIHNDYHTPDDTWQKVNFEGLIKVVDYSENILRTIDERNVELKYIEVIEEESAESRRSQHSYGNVWFGIVPHFDDEPLGCKIGGTSPGSPAQKAGLAENDIITHINNTEIKNLHDFMYTVREYSPGEVLKVRVLRGVEHKEMFFDVKLVAR